MPFTSLKVTLTILTGPFSFGFFGPLANGLDNFRVPLKFSGLFNQKENRRKGRD
jgi:hypothetical protein